MAQEGKYATILAEVEKDLASKSPYVLSSQIWSYLNGRGEYAAERYKSLKNRNIRKAIKPLNELYSLTFNKKNQQALKRFPPTSLNKEINPVVFLELLFAATYVERYDHAQQYADMMLARNSEIFWFPWCAFNVLEWDERVRTRITASLQKGGVLKEKAAERFLLTMLAARPLTEEVMIGCAQEWLKEYPRDAIALEFLGIHLYEAGRYEEAVAAFEESGRIFPYHQRWEKYALALHKLKKVNEADEMLRKGLALTGIKDIEPMLGYRRYTVLASINKDEAWRQLEELNEKWPGHEQLTAARVDLEMTQGRYREALEFARELAKIYPGKREHQARLINALYKSNNADEALKLFATVRKKFPDLTSEFYKVGEEMLAGTENATALEELSRDYARQFPDSKILRERKGDKLVENGRLDEASALYRQMFEITLPYSAQLKKFGAIQVKKNGLAAAIGELDGIVQKNPWKYKPVFLDASRSPEPEKSSAAKVTSSESQPRLVAQIGHDGGVNSLAISPDGNLLVSAGSDNSAIIWNLAERKELMKISHPRSVRAAVFTADNGLLVTGCDDGMLRLWDTASGKLEKEIRVFEGEIYTVALSPVGDSMLIGGGAKSVVLLGIPGYAEQVRLTGHSAGINAIAYSPDGRHAATASIDKTIRVWEIKSGKLLYTLYGHTDSVTSLTFSVDSRFLYSGGVDGKVKLWHLAAEVELADIGTSGRVAAVKNGSSTYTVLAANSSGEILTLNFAANAIEKRIGAGFKDLRTIALLPEKDVLLTAGGDGKVREIRLEDASSQETIAGSVAGMPPYGFSPDSSALVYATKNSVMLWPTDGNGAHVSVSIDDGSGRISWSLSGSGKQLAAYGENGTVVIYGLSAHREISRVKLKTGGLEALRLSTDGSAIATLHRDGTVRLWDGATGAQRAKISQVSPLGTPFIFSADGKQLLVGSEDGYAYLIDTADGSIKQKMSGHQKGLVSVALSADAKKAATSSLDSRIIIRDLTGSTSDKAVDRFKTPAIGLAFAADGKKLLVAASGAPLTEIDSETGAALRDFGARSVDSDQFAISPDKKYIYSGGALYGSRLWEYGSGKEVAAFPTGDSGIIPHEVFSPDGRFAITPGRGGVATLTATATGKELASLISFSDGTWAVVTPDGRFDTNNLEEIRGLHWVMPDDPFTPLPVEAFMKDYYEPRLLAKLMAKNPNLPVIPPPASKNRVQPLVVIDKVEPVAGQRTQVKVTVTAKQMERNLIKSGLRDLRLFRDGQLVKYVRGDMKLESDGTVTKEFTVTLPHAEPGHDKALFTAYAFNSDDIKSRTSNSVPAELPQGVPKRRAYIISVGAAANANPTKDLEFAKADAVAYSTDLSQTLATTGRFSEQDIVPILLTNSDGKWNLGKQYWGNVTNNLARYELVDGVLDLLSGRDIKPEQRRLIPNIDQIRKATPDDLVIISFSGHGVTGKSGVFSLVTAGRLDEQGKIADSLIGSDTLEVWLRDIDAGSITLIIDACHSAAAVGDDSFKPGPMGSRGLGQLAYDKGMKILAATQANNVAKEFEFLGHGLLTYVLLEEGLVAKRAYKSENGAIGLTEWLGYGVEQVPKTYDALMNETFKPVKPVLAGNARRKGDAAGSDATMVKEIRPQPALFDFSRSKQDLPLAK